MSGSVTCTSVWTSCLFMCLLGCMSLDTVFLRLLKVHFLGRLKVISVLQPSKAPAACVWPPWHVGCCWLKFENGQIFHATFVDVAWCCSRLARFVQQFWAWACALLRFSTRNMLQQGCQTRATCCAQHCRDLLRSNVAIVWPKSASAGPTMLENVALRCWPGFKIQPRFVSIFSSAFLKIIFRHQVPMLRVFQKYWVGFSC